MTGIPSAVSDLAEFSPVEDIMLAILRDRLPGVDVKSLIAEAATFPLVVVRRSPQFGDWQGDPRFLDVADIDVHTFAEDPDGDEDAAILAEAVRVILRDAGVNNQYVPGRGHVRKVVMTSAPRLVSDWATATGPVQYADLPTGVSRYEAKYTVWIRKPRVPTFTAQQLP